MAEALSGRVGHTRRAAGVRTRRHAARRRHVYDPVKRVYTARFPLDVRFSKAPRRAVSRGDSAGGPPALQRTGWPVAPRTSGGM